MESKRHCIICNTLKPELDFERVGEHIVPESLGNRILITNRVCRKCNAGLGGTVDYSLLGHLMVAQARYERKVIKSSKSPIESRMGAPDSIIDTNEVSDMGSLDGLPISIMNEKNKGLKKFEESVLLEYTDKDGSKKFLIYHLNDTELTPEIQGALLKIAYEVAHKYLGDEWLLDDTAITIRKILFAYADGNKNEAYRKIKQIKLIRSTKADDFYSSLQTERKAFTDYAIKNKTCVNSLWFIPYFEGVKNGSAVAFDIEGLFMGCVVISNRNYFSKPIMVLPNIKENL